MYKGLWTHSLHCSEFVELTLITLYQHYFPTESERSFGEDGEKLGKELGRNCWGGMGRWVESYGIESYGIESYRVKSGANKKRASKISLRSSLK